MITTSATQLLLQHIIKEVCMKRYYMGSVQFEYYCTMYADNKKEARKKFKNQYGVYPEFIEREEG